MVIRRLIVTFLRTEAAAGVVLASATATALVWANVAGGSYHALWRDRPREWIAEGLMAVFFLVAGLEIRREVATGELADRRTAALPVIAALGGMIAPALLFAAVTGGGRGWAIPMATDIAFAVGVLTLLGDRVPLGLRVFLLALAIADDVGAILVIAVVYGEHVSPWPLAVAGLLVGGWAWLVRRRSPLAVLAAPVIAVLAAVALAAWAATRASGVHPTIAGAALGLAMPPGERAERLETALHPWSAYVVLPLFALSHAGIPLSADALRAAATNRIALGVALGLAVGKPVGVLGASLLAVRRGWARLPDGVSWRQLAGVGCVAGVGFTVSLFVAALAYDAAVVATMGVLAGSAVSATAGALLLRSPVVTRVMTSSQ